MTDDNRALDMELFERVVKQTLLNFDGGVTELGPLAATMAGTIKSDDLMIRRQRSKQTRPIPA
jgi:hypothetical protein